MIRHGLFLFPVLLLAQSGSGLKGDYFSNPNLSGNVALTRIDPTISFIWPSSPGAEIPVDQFSTRWSGQVEAPATGAYTFITDADDGVRLWVNGALLISNWTDRYAARDISKPVTLSAGVKYNIVVEYYERTGAASMKLSWIYPGQGEQVIPQLRLYPTSGSSGETTTPSNPTTPNTPSTPATGKTYVSDLTFTSAIDGWGPVERDKSNNDLALNDGRTITVAGKAYTKGLGVHASSDVRVPLGGKYSVFKATVGIDDEVGNGGSVIFEVWVDGIRKYQSPVVRGSSAAVPVEVSVANASELKLIVTDAGDGISYDHADWADAVLEGSGGTTTPTPPANVPTPPTNLTASPATGQVTLTWQAVSNATGYNVYRGTTPNGQSASPMASNITSTSYTNTGLTNGTTYYYKIRAANGMNMSDLSNEVSAMPMAAASRTYLSDMTFLSAINGWGPLERDKSNNDVALNDGRPISIAGKTYAKGLGVHAASEVKVALGGKYSSFKAIAGVDDEVGDAGSVVFEVWVDGVRKFQSPVIRGSSAALPVEVSTANASELKLIVTTGGDNNSYDHADWADAVLEASGGGTAPTTPTTSVPSAPSNLIATPANAQISLSWQAVSGATSYSIYRGTASGSQGATPIASNVAATNYVSTGLANGTKYFYKVRAVNSAGTGDASNEASAQPAATTTPPPTSNAPTTGPGNLTAVAGNAQIVLTWTAATGATTYNVYRGTAANAQATTPVATSVTGTTYTNTGLTNGTTYFYKVIGVNTGGVGPSSGEASAQPMGAPAVPVLTATSGDKKATLNWTAVNGATSYRIYRGTTANGQAATAIAANVTGITYADSGLTNGTAYFYKITAVNTVGESGRSNEVSVTPTAAAAPSDATTLSAFRLVRQTSWGPKPGEVDRVKNLGRTAYLEEQFNAAPTNWPDSLYGQSLDEVLKYFYQVAMTGNDQLRQRVAFSLSKIWVVNAADPGRSDATVAYYRIFMNRAFGNYRDLMTDMTLNPAMGRYLTMLGGKSQAATGFPANENYPRELMQLFTLGLSKLNNDGSSQGTPTYTEEDVKALARIFTGYTVGDGNPTTIPTDTNNTPNWVAPMEGVERYHDITAKTFLGTSFAPNRSSKQDLDQALDLIFNQPTLPPFICKQLIMQLVTSNPSPGYVTAVTNAFINNGSNVRGDMKAVLRAIFNHPEANLGDGTQGKLMEPALLMTSPLRTLNATVTNSNFMVTNAGDIGQRVLFSPSVFSYFSPNFRIRNGALSGPEFQLHTSASTLTRTNYIARILNNDTGGGTSIDYSAYTSKAGDAATLVDYAALQFMGGQISADMRNAIISAVNVSPASDTTERVRTALYLILTSAQYQVDR